MIIELFNNNVIDYPNEEIEIYIWDRLPNLDLEGISLYGRFNINENFSLTLNQPYQWISIFARNSNFDYDGCCFNIDGNIIRIFGFD
jgi:hypothetical protein